VYQDHEQIGSGGFGKVMRCVRSDDNVAFARKILIVEDGVSIKRFQREVRILQKLGHPRIIRIEAAHVEESPYWFVMPLYKRSLREVIPELSGDRKRIASMFDGILEGMEYAHKQGIIHRDLKPENILLDDDDDLVISDFGLGRAMSALTSRATGSNAWIGTLAYMAPEQTTNAEHSNERSDIFTLGRILYELFTGDPPLSIPDLVKLPIGIAAVVQRCTKTNPVDRFESVRELRKSFQLVAISRSDANGETELRKLVGEIAAQKSATVEQVTRLAELISQCQEDAALLHEIAVALPGVVFSSLEAYDSAISRILAVRFASVAVAQDWPFTYTDDIGSACRKIYNATSDPEIKGLMTRTALSVGASHNRFQVMGDAAVMITHATEERDARAIAHALEPVMDRLWAVREKIDVRKIHKELRELFDRTS
jgi:serine/threonine protein kinase